MIVKSLENFEFFGVYKILNIKNKKYYIGSTTRSFKKRFDEHQFELVNNKHKNYYLQNSFNKHGDHNFEFIILEVVSDVSIIFDRENYYLNLENNNLLLYNINKIASGGIQFSQEVYKKRAKTLRETRSIAFNYYTKFINKEILLGDIPEKYFKLVKQEANTKIIHWAQGKTIANGYDWSFLKGNKKTLSEVTKKSYKIRSINQRENKTSYIEVYDTFGNFIKTFRSATDIEEYSIKNLNYFPTLDKNSNSRTSTWVLKKQNILNCCNNLTTHYKGLQFKFVNSDKEIKFLTILDLNSKIINQRSDGKKIYRRKDCLYDRYCRLLEQSSLKNSLNSVKVLEQDNTEPSIILKE